MQRSPWSLSSVSRLKFGAVVKADLRNVTLFVTDTRCHDLMQIALTEMVNAATFGDVVIASNDFTKLKSPSALNVAIDDWPTKLAWERFIWERAYHYVHTSHVMFMEWDAGVFDPKMWNPAFLQFDYIGAPWWYQDGLNVGNGGLSMRSHKLMHQLVIDAKHFPVIEPGDDTLCRKYRKRLEVYGHKWAPEDLAHQFAFECTRPFPSSRHFGYHAMRNWPHVMDRDKLIERTRLAVANRYISGTGMLDQLYHVAPWLRQAAAA